MSPSETKRNAAVRVADALNKIEGAPVSAFAEDLSVMWVKGEITGEEMKKALLKKHKKVS